MFKASVKMLFMRQASALQSARLSSRPNTGQQRNVGRYFLKNATRLWRNEMIYWFWCWCLLKVKHLLEKKSSWLVVNSLISPVSKQQANRRRRLKGIHSRSDTNRTGAEGLSFYYPRLLHCLNQMLAVVLLSQHRVSSSKTVRPRASCGAQCIGHAVRTWSAVCPEVPHSQFGERARPHLVHGRMESPNISLVSTNKQSVVPTKRVLWPIFFFCFFFFFFWPFHLIRSFHSVSCFSTAFCFECSSSSHQVPSYPSSLHPEIFSSASLFSSFHFYL